MFLFDVRPKGLTTPQFVFAMAVMAAMAVLQPFSYRFDASVDCSNDCNHTCVQRTARS